MSRGRVITVQVHLAAPQPQQNITLTTYHPMVLIQMAEDPRMDGTMLQIQGKSQISFDGESDEN